MGVSLTYRAAGPIDADAVREILAQAEALKWPWWAESLFFPGPGENALDLYGDTKLFRLSDETLDGEKEYVDPADDAAMAWRDATFIVSQLSQWAKRFDVTWQLECEGKSAGTVAPDAVSPETERFLGSLALLGAIDPTNPDARIREVLDRDSPPPALESSVGSARELSGTELEAFRCWVAQTGMDCYPFRMQLLFLLEYLTTRGEVATPVAFVQALYAIGDFRHLGSDRPLRPTASKLEAGVLSLHRAGEAPYVIEGGVLRHPWDTLALQWRLTVATASRQKAEHAASAIASAVAREMSSVVVAPHRDPGNFEVGFATPLLSVAWARAVTEALSLSQKVAKRWSVKLGVPPSLSAESNHVSQGAVVAAAWNVVATGGVGPNNALQRTRFARR